MKPSQLGILLCLSLSLPAVAFADPAEMPTHPYLVGPQLGVQFHNDTNFQLGAEGRFGVYMFTPSIRLDIVPDFNYYFVDGGHAFEVSANAVVAFGVHNDLFEPYALVGLGIFNVGASDCSRGGCSDTNLGFNIGGGVKFFPTKMVQPYAQIRFTIGSEDTEPFNLTAGVLFLLQ